MDNSENKIQNDDYMDEIEHLNNRINDIKRFLSNQLKDIKDLSESNESIMGELDSLKDKYGDIQVLSESNESIMGELEALKNENKKLKNQNAKTNKILNSYNESFKFLFYFYDLEPKRLLKNIQDICV